MREGEKRIAELSTQSLLIVELLNPNISFRYLTVWEKKKDFSEKSAYRASPGLPLKAPDRGESSKPRSREDQEEIASDPVCTRTAAHQSNPTRACAPELSKTEMHALPASPPSAASSSLQDMPHPWIWRALGPPPGTFQGRGPAHYSKSFPLVWGDGEGALRSCSGKSLNPSVPQVLCLSWA